MLKRLSLLLILLAIPAAAGLWVIFGPNTAVYREAKGVKIPPGSDFDVVVDSLEAAGILGSSTTFRLLGTATGWRNQVKAGYYEFSAGASNYRMLDVIRKGLQTPVRFTIPPGTHAAQVAALAARKFNFSADAFRKALADTTLAREIGADPAYLFGYMMPETYSFYWLTPPETLIRRIKQQFDGYYDRNLRKAADSMGFSREQVVTLASIVEWETSLEEEKPRVAGVYLNRLRIGMPLQADPTVQFAVMQREGRKRRLLFEDLRSADPYNTYRNPGLPPGPITNPSPSSMAAVVRPERHDYLFFVATGNGGHVFSRTFGEHGRAANAYRQMMEQRRQQQATPPATTPPGNR